MENKESTYLRIEAGDFDIIEAISSEIDIEVIKSNISNKLSNNEIELQNIIMKNSEIIVNLFNNAKNIKEELVKSNKNLELLECQISMYLNINFSIKKKYLDSFEKFENIIENKKNIDKTIEIFDKIKIFKSEIKLLKLQINSQDPSLLDSSTLFLAFSKIKNILKQNEIIFKEIDYIKKDLDFFLANQKTIINNFENKLADSILKKDNPSILKYLEYFSTLGLLVEQIHSFTNNFLTETIAKTYLAKIKKITDIFKNSQIEINMIKPESIIEAREEFKNSLNEIGKMNNCMQNFCLILRSEFDKNNFVLFDQIIENQGFKNLFSLFADRIRKLILSALSKIQKFPDTFSYFQKDYLVLHFIMKEFCLENSMEFIVIPQIKDAFIDQFKTSIFENFTLAINLILNSEKTFSNSISNNLVKSHLIEYMISYIYQLNNIFIELEIEFSLYKENNVTDDELVFTLVEIISNLFNEIYLKKLISIIDSIFFTSSSQSNSQNNQIILTQNFDFNVKKFNFFTFILIKLIQTLDDIKDKNERLLGRKINFSLINSEIINIINNNIEVYFRNYFTKFLSKISNEVRVIFLENEINELYFLFKFSKTFFEKISGILLEYISSFDEDFSNNKYFDVFTIKFVIYNYFYISFILLLSIKKQNEKELNLGFFDDFLSIFNKNFKLKDVIFISQTQKEVKNFILLSQENLIDQSKSNSNDIILFILCVRLLYFEKKSLFAFLKKTKLNIEFFVKSITIIFLQKFNLNLGSLILIENNYQLNLLEVSKFMSEFSSSLNINIKIEK